MKIDFRKKDQHFKNKHGLNDVYLWKEDFGIFRVGINGTSEHYIIERNQVSEYVEKLVNFNISKVAD